MSNSIIFLFIVIANAIAIMFSYHSFDKNIEKNKRVMYTMISVGIMYIVTLITYFFSSIGIEKEVAQKSKDMIIFSFVPVNTIIIIPFIVSSFYKKKKGIITLEQLNTRTIIMIVITIVLLIGEFFYFRNIEKGIMNIANQKQNAEVTNTLLDNN